VSGIRALEPSLDSRGVTASAPRGALLRIATVAWIAGMATLFPLGNDALEVVSILTFDRIAFLAVLALSAVEVIRRPRVLRHAGRVEAAFGAYLGVVLLSWLSSLSEKSALDAKRDGDLLLMCFAMPALAFAIARHGEWTHRQVRICAWVLFAGVGAYFVAVGFVQAFVDWSFLVPEAAWDVHRNRARGPFPNALPYSIVLALLLLLAPFLAADGLPRRQRWWIGALGAALLEAFVLSRIRIVWAALATALSFVAFTGPPMRRTSLLMLSGLALAMFVAYSGLDGRLALPRGALRVEGFSERVLDAEPVYNRIAVYSTALNMIRHRPLFGFGVGSRTFRNLKAEYYTSCCGVSVQWAESSDVPHNEILNLLVLMGVVGLLAYLGLVWTLWRSLSLAQEPLPDPGEAALMTCVRAQFILLVGTAVLHDTMYLAQAQVIFFFFAGLATRVHVRAETA